MTWNAQQTRGEILREVSAVADARRDGELPLHVEGVRKAFVDELDRSVLSSCAGTPGSLARSNAP